MTPGERKGTEGFLPSAVKHELFSAFHAIKAPGPVGLAFPFDLHMGCVLGDLRLGAKAIIDFKDTQLLPVAIGFNGGFCITSRLLAGVREAAHVCTPHHVRQSIRHRRRIRAGAQDERSICALQRLEARMFLSRALARGQ